MKFVTVILQSFPKNVFSLDCLLQSYEIFFKNARVNVFVIK